MTDTTKQRATGQNRETILKVITDLTEHGHQASRRRIVEVTGLSMGIVDDHISRLREDGVIRSLYAGLFELVDTTPDRVVSVTALPRGQLKVEVGDDVCEALTPREALALAKLLAGVELDALARLPEPEPAPARARRCHFHRWWPRVHDGH